MVGACGRVGFEVTSGDATRDDAAPLAGNRAFVTSTLQTPVSLGGLPGADALCTDRAHGVGLPGTFVAWLSSSTTNAPDRLAGRGWVRLDGKPFARTLDDIANGAMLYPLRVDERGTDLGDGANYVVTGTYGSVANRTCSDYTAPLETAAAGVASYTGSGWTNIDDHPCDEPRAEESLCREQCAAGVCAR